MSETRKHLSDCVWAGQPLSAAMSCHCTATPPAPDLAVVRDALVCVLQSASLKSVDNLDDVLGSRHTAKFEDTADALLAAVSRPAEIVAQDGGSSVPTPEDLAFRRGVYAERAEWSKATGAAHWSEVSRPAEARGEPDYLALTDRNGHILTTRKASEGAEYILAQFPADELPNHAPFTLVPLYAHPAPSGGEGDAEGASQAMTARVSRALAAQVRAAPRPEPGEVSESRANVGRDRVQEAARRGGYFWLPCRICGEHFAGFEWGESLEVTATTGEGTCNKVSCIAETKRRNAAQREPRP